MKTFLVLFLIFFSFTYQGPAANEKHAESSYTCGEEESQTSVSDCVDSQLYIDDKYYDRCCFIRAQYEGEIRQFCYYLTEEQYLDITETINSIEDNIYKRYIKSEGEGKRVKIYQLDCAASYIKFLSIASILLALLI